MRMARETTFGIAPSFSAENTLWVRGDGDDFCSLRTGFDQRVMGTAAGHRRTWLAQAGPARLVGRLKTWAFPASALELIEWATAVANNNTQSYTVDVDDGHRVLRYLGVKVRRLMISGGARSKEQAIRLRYELIGKSQEPLDGLPSGAHEKQIAYTHKNATIAVDGTVRANVNRWQILINNRLRMGSPAGEQNDWIDLDGREITAELTSGHEDAALAVAYESARPIDLRIAIGHSLGAAYQLTVDLRSNVRMTSFQVERPLGSIARSRLSLAALLTDSIGEDFRITMG